MKRNKKKYILLYLNENKKKFYVIKCSKDENNKKTNKQTTNIQTASATATIAK